MKARRKSVSASHTPRKNHPLKMGAKSFFKNKQTNKPSFIEIQHAMKFTLLKWTIQWLLVIFGGYAIIPTVQVITVIPRRSLVPIYGWFPWPVLFLWTCLSGPLMSMESHSVTFYDWLLFWAWCFEVHPCCGLKTSRSEQKPITESQSSLKENQSILK